MNYAGCTNEFTPGQRAVSKDALVNIRTSYLNSPAFGSCDAVELTISAITSNSFTVDWPLDANTTNTNKNSKNNLDALDLNLDLRIRVGENIPWYAAILGGLPAVAGSAVINEIFEEDINNLTNYQYEIVGTISEPKLKRIK